jgi:hypothetical protein
MYGTKQGTELGEYCTALSQEFISRSPFGRNAGMKILMSLFALLILAGGPSVATADDCVQRMLSSREYQALKAKLPPLEPGTLPSLAQQTDPSKATAEELRLVRSFHEKYVTPCRLEGLRSNNDPAVLAVLTESFAKSDASWLALVEGKITWGQYNKDVHALRTETRMRLLAISR